MSERASTLKKKGEEPELDGLTPYQQSRIRTNMWFGSVDPVTDTLVQFDGEKLVPMEVTFVQALATYLREIPDNSLDEMVGKGHGNRLDISYDPKTMVFKVEDNGRGVPLPMIRQAFTNTTEDGRYLYTGRNFREREEVGGQNGVGASVTNNTSQFFRVTVWRDGKEYWQEFKEDPFGLSETFGPHDIVVGKATIKPYAGKQTGTRIEFCPSESVYKNRTLPLEYVEGRCWEIAAINPKLRVTFNGRHLKASPRIEDTFFKGLDPITIEIDDRDNKFRSTFYLVPQFRAEGEEMVHSVVNNIPAYDKGGKHIAAFRSVFYNGLRQSLAKESKRRKLEPNNSDISEGLLIYNVTKMHAPNFDSQSKTKLTNEIADKVVRRHFDGEAAFKKIIKEHGEWVEQIFARCAKRTQKKDEDDAKRELRKKSRARIAKLSDATGRDRGKCILYLAEGDSAIKGIVNARESAELVGCLPLRGKIMNVHGKSAMEVAQNEPLSDMMATIGLRRGERAIRASLRYGKVYLATDEDDDGYNIFALLINFFYREWPELFDPDLPPFFFRFGTPFVILRKGAQRKYVYGSEYDSFDLNDTKGWKVLRAKGLSTLDKEDWKHAISHPDLTPITDEFVVEDEEKKSLLLEALDLIFDQVSPEAPDRRKEWIALGR